MIEHVPEHVVEAVARETCTARTYARRRITEYAARGLTPADVIANLSARMEDTDANQ